jgi:hypothetical protein
MKESTFNTLSPCIHCGKYTISLALSNICFQCKREKSMKNVFNKMEAIEYLIENNRASTEWQEAGMFDAIRTIIKTKYDKAYFTKETLNKFLEEAYNY